MRASTLILVGSLALSATHAWGAADEVKSSPVAVLPPAAAARPPEAVPQINSYRIATIAAGVVAGVIVVNAVAGVAVTVGVATIAGPVLATVARDAAIAVGATVGGVLGNWAYLNGQ